MPVLYSVTLFCTSGSEFIIINVISYVSLYLTLKVRISGWVHNKVVSSDLYSYSDDANIMRK